METLTARVAARTQATRDIACFDLIATDERSLPTFTAGAHIDLHLANGLIRAYSMWNDASEHGHYRIAVLREPQSRGGSAMLCERVRAGDTLVISPPRNKFRLLPARHTLLLAGGIGVTPLLSMAHQLARMQADFTLHYYNKTRARAAFLPEIAAAPWADHAELYFSDEVGHARARISDLLARIDPFTHLYACGPAGFIEHVIRCAVQAGLAERQIHVEPFALPASMKPDYAGPAFQVKLRSSGRVYTIPADEPPTKALARQGVRIPVSCEEGNCGTCQTGVLEGVPDHRDVYLTAEQRATNRTFMPCCSRAKTPLLVLDL